MDLHMRAYLRDLCQAKYSGGSQDGRHCGKAVYELLKLGFIRRRWFFSGPFVITDKGLQAL